MGYRDVRMKAHLLQLLTSSSCCDLLQATVNASHCKCPRLSFYALQQCQFVLYSMLWFHLNQGVPAL